MLTIAEYHKTLAAATMKGIHNMVNHQLLALLAYLISDCNFQIPRLYVKLYAQFSECLYSEFNIDYSTLNKCIQIRLHCV